MKRMTLIFFAMIIFGIAEAQELKPISLPPPDTTGGKPLMQTIKLRKSTREFSQEKIAPQVLSNLLWAAFGINRADGHRTAPSAMNWQEIDIYAVMENGTFLYDARTHSLLPVVPGDLREKTGTQAFVKDAPLNLVYIADLAKVKRATGEDQMIYLGADAGFISQNVYLFCASEGLATVVRGSVDKKELPKLLKLRDDQKIILGQTIGYPKK
jgi:SagB-type dehydrogenase family enzyme